ncbi:hypothetical protein CGMCC3_g17644 [Colletotrichum fructicola]|nr:uncharacterized protein CGMCC3_g17644 [Colletotrichum fructicola]KAE9566186.1 hypothetical protein CGMCC3_g17644 [Colletotrichum fructicola]
MGSVDSGNCRTALYSVPICRPVRYQALVWPAKCTQASDVNDVAHFVVHSTPCKHRYFGAHTQADPVRVQEDTFHRPGSSGAMLRCLTWAKEALRGPANGHNPMRSTRVVPQKGAFLTNYAAGVQYRNCNSLQPKQRVIKFYIAPRPEHQSAPGCLRWRLCVSRLKLDLGSSGTYVGARRGVKSCLYPMNA